MHTSNHIYHHGQEELHGFIAHDAKIDTPRPAVIVMHDWSGRNEFACNKAQVLAELGYVGFAVDMYGKARLGATNEEKMALMQPLTSNRRFLSERVNVALDTVKLLPQVDPNRIAVIGFCFGGLCALDLARSGADLRGVVSFHGLLAKPEHKTAESIKAKILVLHGYDDPMVNPQQVNAFCAEMNAAKADWQVHMYGLVQHAFTNPVAHDLDLGLIYNEQAAKRSWITMTNFLQEIF